MSELSDKILQISVDYLGPAAGKFLDRQTTSHMGGLNFNEITAENIPQLSWWVHVSAKLILDPAKAKDFSDKIAKLGGTSAPGIR